MKKISALIFSFLLIVSVIFSGGCNFNKEESGNTVSSSHRNNWDELFTAEWTYELKGLEASYFAVLEGTIQSSTVPNKIKVACNDCEKEVEMTNIVEENDCYIITVKGKIAYDNLNQGSYEATLKGYFYDGIKEIDDKATLIVDDDYIGIASFNFETDKPEFVMELKEHYFPSIGNV